MPGEKSVLLQALKGENRGRAPVWLMRQAGRYLPEYRELRKKYSLKELFFTPELAAQVTLMPIERFGVDAAILFSDITVVAEALGLRLDFSEGPVVEPKATADNLRFDLAKLEPIIETVRILKKELEEPLIGFCGGPFTVASYLIGDLGEAKQRLDDADFQRLLGKVEDVSIAYLQMQVKAGVDAIQVFDSWANVLSPEQFRRFSLPFLHRVCREVEAPAIFFMRGAGEYVEEIPCAVSLDWETDPSEARLKTDKPLQGNLNPDFLFEPLAAIEKKTKELLSSMKDDPSFILNLGHGVKPNTPVDAVRCFVETAKQV